MTAVIIAVVDIAIAVGLWSLLAAVIAMSMYLGMQVAEGVVNMYDARKEKRQYKKAKEEKAKQDPNMQDAQYQTV